MATTTGKYYDHIFYPWKTKGETRVVPSESIWRAPTQWDVCVASENKGRAHTGMALLGRPRVLVDCDVFEDWQGPMLNSQGERIANSPCGPNRHHGQWIGINAEIQAMVERGELRNANSSWVTMASVRAHLFSLIDATPNLDWLLTTAHPENIAATIPPKPDDSPKLFDPDGVAVGCGVRGTPVPQSDRTGA